MFTLLMPYPAALIKTAKTKTLVIADPHIGWETSLQNKGIHVPSQTQKIQKKLLTILSKYHPDNLLILGDVKYTIVHSEFGEWHDIPEFFSQIKQHVANISIVRGNHDANLEHLLPQNAVTMHPASGITEAEVGLFHGHKWPSPLLLSCKTLVMGHLHPVVVFRDPTGFKLTRQVWMKINCDTLALTKILLEKNNVKIERNPTETLQNHYQITPKTTQLFIMPSFNDFLGGRPVNEINPGGDINEELIGPVLRSKAVDLENSELYLLDGTYLGTLNQLRKQ
jgi:putative SbcD/Mre11-related phosphoesterase